MTSRPRNRSIGLFVALLTVALFSSMGLAQNRQPGDRQGGAGRREMGPAMVDRMQALTADLNLEGDQKTKLDEVFNTARADLQALMEETRDLEPRERGQRTGEFMAQLQDNVKAVLNEEQRAAFDEKLRESRRGPGGGGAQGQGAGRAGGDVIRRMRDAVDRLNLTEEQKPQIETIMRDAAQQFRTAREESQSDPQVMRQKAQAIRDDTVAQLREVLTPEQQQKFREVMAGDDANNDNTRERRREQRDGAPATQPATQPSAPGEPRSMAPPGLPDRLEVGQLAPDFAAKKLDGAAVQLSSFKGRLVLLSFGSYSSPSFRHRAVALEALRRDFGTKLTTLVIYTREAHATGGWEIERNRDEEIEVPDHRDEAHRRTIAKAARDRLKLGMTVLTDDMDNSAATAYRAFPNNAAVLIGRDGTVLAYQKWFDPYVMRDQIAQALASRQAAPAAMPGR